jgi:hypothetical protein
MLPIALAGVSAGLSVLSGIESNKAITQAATAQYESQKLFIERDNSVGNENLAYQASEVNNELGMALSQLSMQANQVFAKMSVADTERNVYGNTAARRQAVAKMQEALSADSLAQAAESKMIDVQTQMRNLKYETEAKHVQNMQNYNNAMSQRKSTLSLVADGISAGVSGYSAGLSIQSSRALLASRQASLGKLQGMGGS